MRNLPRNIWILLLTFSIFMSLHMLIIFIGSIVGKSLAPVENLSTIPVAMLALGLFSGIIPINHITKKIGRKYIFLWNCVYGVNIMALIVFSLLIKSFYLFCFSMLLLGISMAIMNQFKFAAIESVDKNTQVLAMSVVVFGGVLAAFLGPEFAVLGKDLFKAEFVGSFVLIGCSLVVAFIALLYYKDKEINEEHMFSKSRPIKEFFSQKVFIVAVSSSVLAYVVMGYLITAIPMVMFSIDGFSLEEIKFVIQLNVIAMFLPSIFTPFFVKFLGLEKMIIMGVLMLFFAIIVAYIGNDFINYIILLILLGIGWNFLHIGGTNLLSESYLEYEGFKVQTLSDLSVFGMRSIAVIISGWVLFQFGWSAVLLLPVPLILLQLGLIIWWIKKPNF